MNKVKYFRESKNITQSELAEQSRLSLRTIQRIESGIEPKGHTLKMLAKVFDVECFELFEIPESCSNETDVIKSIKTLNTSILTFLIIPYGNIVFPLIIYFKNKEKEFRKVASDIISLQILWTLITSVLLILSPFIQDKFGFDSPLILWIGLLCFIVNLTVNFLNANSLNKVGKLKISSPISFF
jgi:transcriptional regulator with XRE-family HTH domain